MFKAFTKILWAVKAKHLGYLRNVVAMLPDKLFGFVYFKAVIVADNSVGTIG